jgi:TPP-dependent pyruvate/acetoin dehydrogenase alpha subunit
MKRYPAFDPPEYVDWHPQPELIEAFGALVRSDPDRARVVAALDREDHRLLYRDLLINRLHDIGLKRWVRQGVISKAWLGTGEEAVTVGATRALDVDVDVVCPMIRNAGACHVMGMSLESMFRSYLATEDSPSGGRDLHAGDQSEGVIQPISHMGTSVCIITGVALAFRQRAEPRVALTWIGDGATKTAACHEGLNLAAVLGVPAIFVIQNNQVALGTRASQHGAGDLARWPEMYGLPSFPCDGNNVLDVFAATRLAAELCRNGDGPAVVIAETFRMGGHATHDEREARTTFSPQLFATWGRRDPVGLYEEYLVRQGFDRMDLAAIEQDATDLVERAAEVALESRGNDPEPAFALYEGVSEGGSLIGLENRPI